MSFRCKIYASILEWGIIYNIALPPKIPLWHVLCSGDEYAYTGGVCIYGWTYTFSQALKLWQPYLHL